MKKNTKTNEQLLEKIGKLNEKIVELEKFKTESTRSEELLRESEARLNEAQRLAQIGSWELDLITNTLYWSDEVYRLFDLEPQQFGATYEAFLNNIHPDDREFVNNAYSESIKNKTPYDVVHRLLLKDGTIKSVNECCKTYYDDTGKALRSIGTVQDITERKQTEEKITRFSRIFEDSLNEIYLFDADTLIFTQVNRAAQHNLGYTMEELQKLTPLDIKPDFTIELFAKLVAPLRKGEKEKILFETVHQRKDQSLYNVEVHLQLLRFENKAMFSAIISDITERKQAEIKLRRSNAFLEKLTSSMPDAIFSVKMPERVIDWVNDSFGVIGCEPGECIGKDTSFLHIDKDHFLDFGNKLKDALAAGKEVLLTEHQLKRKNGEIFPAEITVTFIKENEEIINVTSVIRDITGRKQAESELQMERDKLTAIFESMQDGVYIVNKDYEIQYVNPVLKKDFGSPEGKKCYEYFHNSGEPCTFCKNDEVFAGKTVQWEWTSPKNGKTYDLIDTPMINTDGSIGKLEMFRDITDRKQAEKKLENHQEHLEEIVKERTKELEDKNEELDKAMKVFVGRELKIRDLQKRISALEGKESS